MEFRPISAPILSEIVSQNHLHPLIRRMNLHFVLLYIIFEKRITSGSKLIHICYSLINLFSLDFDDPIPSSFLRNHKTGTISPCWIYQGYQIPIAGNFLRLLLYLSSSLIYPRKPSHIHVAIILSKRLPASYFQLKMLRMTSFLVWRTPLKILESSLILKI